MSTDALDQLSNDQIIEAAVRGQLTELQVKQLVERDSTLAALALIATMQAIRQLQGLTPPAGKDVSAPSGQQPVHTKPSRAKGSRRKKRGARKGHPGHHRPPPEKIDRRVEHPPLERCPDCGGKLCKPRKRRRRLIIDLPEDLSTETTEHSIWRQWCGGCRRYVERVVPDAMPKATLGHMVIATMAWFHYALGLTIDQIVRILGYHLNTTLSAGGLVATWHRTGIDLLPWYEQIGEAAKQSAYLHADETGWRVDGQTNWLWCFANDRCCYYMIDPSRGSPALGKFFTQEFDGVLITDFWAAYDYVGAAERQFCLAHLLRELEKVDQHNESAEWQAFAKKLRGLVGDAIRLRRRSENPGEEYPRRVKRIDDRLNEMADASYQDADAKRLANRLGRHRDWLFTFLDRPELPSDNNFAERQIRPAVILRKNSQSNRSERGAATQAVLMSIFRTLRMRGLDPIKTVADALRQKVLTGELPPLPDQPVAPE